MSLFDFIADVGQKLFTSDEEAAEKIKAHLEANNPGIENLEVAYQEQTAILRGTAASYAAMEKAILLAGNLQGVANVVNELTVAEEAEPEEKVEYYVIQKGDTLSKIAQRYYGDPMAYPRIFEANREVIQNPDKIYPGQKIRIPL